MIYVHVPFCKRFCTYCGFFSEVCKGTAQIADYVDEVCREISSRAAEIAATASVNTLYIGGGTPSVLPLSALGRVVDTCREALRSLGLPADFEEFTVEVNPEDIVEKGPEYVRGLRSLGVNRISMGVQSFDDGILRWMNRRHTAERALRAFNLLREGGFDNISIDLIFGLSQLSDDLWRSTLEQALALEPEHISSYQLSVEEGSALERQVQEGRYAEASDEQCRRQYDILCQVLASAGYRHYEISNFARPGFEARHNAAYWRRVPYAGFGPGAHSLLPDGRTRRWNSDELPDWRVAQEFLTGEDMRVERLMLALRTDAGLPGEEMERLADAGAVSRLLSEGALAETPDGRIRIPEDHFFVSDEIIREVLP